MDEEIDDAMIQKKPKFWPIYVLLLIIAPCVVLIFGLLAAVGKNKNVRLLGLSMLIAGICAFLSRTGNLLVTLVDKEVLDRQIYFNDTYDNIVLM